MTIIQHKFQHEMFIPWGAINDQDSFITEEKPIVTTCDDIKAKVLVKSELHILSNEAKKIIWRLYGLSTDKYLAMWYSKIPEMYSMYFVQLKLEKIENDTTTGIPAKD